METGSYSITELPNMKTRPYAFYRHLDGRVVRLPADPYSIKHYLQKGLVMVSGEESVLPEPELLFSEPEEVPIDKPVKTRRKSKKRRKL